MAETGGAQPHPHRHLFHIPLQVAVVALCLYWYWHIPAPSKAVLLLGGVAALMTLVEMRPLHKAIYFVLIIALMFVENRAIDKDRATFAQEQADARRKENEAFGEIAKGIDTAIEDSEQQFKETNARGERQFNATLETENRNLRQTLGGLKETVKAATGGDGFCYALVIPPGYASNTAGFASIISRGKYPLTNINALVEDDDMVIEHLNEANKNPQHAAEEFGNLIERSQEWVHVGDLPPQFSEVFSIRAALAPVQDRRMVTITFWANNGHWTEKFALRKVNGQWLRLIRVWKDKLDKKKKAMVADMLFEQIDPGFPEDLNTKASGALSASPSH